MQRVRNLLAFGACLAAPLALHADFNYQETTQITGGSIVSLMKMAGVFSSQARKADQPIVSTVWVKGNRMARLGPDVSEIVDLDRETITRVDHQKRQYTVVTFEQMKQQMQQAEQEAQQKAAEQQKFAPAGGAQATEPPQNVDMSFDVHVRQTGASKQVSGMDTKEAILTLALIAKDKTTQQQGAMSITNDMWMAPDIPGYDEVRQFNERFAKKMGQLFSGDPMFTTLMNQPGAGKGLVQLNSEVTKLKGIPVLQIMRMGSTADGKPLPAASEGPLPLTNATPMPSAGDIAQQTATSMAANKIKGLGSAIAFGGGFKGFGRQKKAEAQQDAANAGDQASSAAANKVESKPGQPGSAQAPAASVLIESNTRLGNFSTAPIEDARFEPPAGYKQVQPDPKHPMM